MKKTMPLLFPALLFILFGLFFRLPADAAENEPNPVPEPGQQELVIDGVYYHLIWGSNYTGTASASLELPEGSTEVPPDEITVRSEITWNGITFPVTSLRSDTTDDIGELTRRKGRLSGYNKEHLRKITIESGVQDIILSLSHYKALEEIVIENPSESIYAHFSIWDCPKLKDIYVPSNVDSVPQLRDCPNASVIYARDHPKYKIIDGDIYSRNEKTLYDVPSTTKKYVVKDGVERIAFGAFAGNSNIKKIIIPDSVRKIERKAFYNMTNLKKVKFGNSVRKIYGGSFRRCNNLKVLVLAKNIRQVTDGFGGQRVCKLKRLYTNSP